MHLYFEFYTTPINNKQDGFSFKAVKEKFDAINHHQVACDENNMIPLNSNSRSKNNGIESMLMVVGSLDETIVGF